MFHAFAKIPSETLFEETKALANTSFRGNFKNKLVCFS